MHILCSNNLNAVDNINEVVSDILRAYPTASWLMLYQLAWKGFKAHHKQYAATSVRQYARVWDLSLRMLA